MIPKIIWTYWDKDDIPIYIQDCLNTWKYYCKNNWSINILNKDTIKLFLKEDIDYPKNIWNDSGVKQGDMFGVALVNKYGGIWMDSNIIMLQPIDFILNKEEWFGYCGYYLNKGESEAFLFASYKNSYTIKKIHNLFFKIFSLKEKERLKILKEEYSINESYLYPQKLIDYLISNDNKIREIIMNNSINNTNNNIYSLIYYLVSNKLLFKKEDLITFLVCKEGDIPINVLNQPLLKLQGANIQKVSENKNKNSWWYKLTNNY
jgi:hypothetical protein